MASETIANGTNKIIHRLDLNEYGLRDVPDDLKSNAKQDVADYLQNEILRDVSKGTSPVQGEGRFRRVEKDYAVREKGGARLSNLENDGDLLSDFKVVPTDGSFIDAGHTGDETPKSDGHNQLSSKAKAWARKSRFPKRRYIPDDRQTFVPKITNEIKKIIGEFVPAQAPVEEDDIFEPNITPSSTIETADEIGVTVDSLFGDDVIASLLDDAIARRGGF